MNLPRSSFYYRGTSSEVGPTDAEVIALVEDIQDEFPRYGYRRVTHELRLISREIVLADRPSLRAIARKPVPRAHSRAISSRSENERLRRFGRGADGAR